MTIFDAPLPHSEAGELGLLSACLLDPQSLADSVDLLSPGDFYSSRNGKVFKIFMECASKNPTEPLEIAEVMSGLQREGVSLSVIPELMAEPGAFNIASVAGIIKDKSIVRRTIAVSMAGIKNLMACNGDAHEIIDAYQRQILSIEISGGAECEATKISDLVNDAVDGYEAAKTKGGVTGLPTGLCDLDAVLGGLQPSDLIILAARPSMGKTAMAVNMAENCKAPALIFSLEMAKNQLADRMLSGRSKINLNRLTTGKLYGNDEWAKLNQAAGELADLQIFIDDSPSLHFSEITRRARIAYKRHGIRLVVIDYLQLMRGDAAKGNREAEIASISRALKGLAKELCIPVLALSQLNRELEKRSEKRPQLSDLRESGQIEQDADVILFLYRDEVYNRAPGNPDRGTAEIIVAKHRNGPIGFAKVAFCPETTTFKGLYRK
ncbi:MAG: replicative DNA helicase [Deltaproteobacteria bacterium]|nr:replicative DNA helicase [Deltaproteobacteria bacterium]